ncbi:MAG: UDP binding domain-containing protein [Bacillota bacterium]|nr:UDP binding domain-containing protein [Bacillota bacterium]
MARCTIIGMGHIGKALYADLNGRVDSLNGLDANHERVKALREQGYRVSTDHTGCEGTDTWIITASTGLDMSNMLEIARSFVPAPGALVSVESTLSVGTMARLAAYYLSEGISPGSDVYLVHAPHRVMFGHDHSTLSMPRVIGGITPECLARGMSFYSQLGASLVPVQDIRVAELSKLVENSLRHVNIAFAEAIAVACSQAGMDFPALRSAVNTKGNVHLMDVDYGIGGECLPKDIRLLQHFAGSPLFESAILADRDYQRNLLDHAQQAGEKVLVRGITYKPGVPDVEHSLALDLALALQDAGSSVEVYDPLVPPAEVLRLGLVPAEDPFNTQGYDIIIERGRIVHERLVADVQDTGDRE